MPHEMAMVTRENDQRFFRHAGLLQTVENVTNAFIHERDHSVIDRKITGTLCMAQGVPVKPMHPIAIRLLPCREIGIFFLGHLKVHGIRVVLALDDIRHSKKLRVIHGRPGLWNEVWRMGVRKAGP